MESLALLVSLMLIATFLAPIFVYLTFKLLNRFTINKRVGYSIVFISIIELMAWVALYINFTIHVNNFAKLVISLSLIGVYFAGREIQIFLNKYMSKEEK